ncbi:MAG: transcriptional regulator [Chloroflexi bacterium]|nr:transcriptional regulator [Chloroflexota bacterium]
MSVKKEFVARKPCTRYSMTSKGRTAFSAYLRQLTSLIEFVRPALADSPHRMRQAERTRLPRVADSNA